MHIGIVRFPHLGLRLDFLVQGCDLHLVPAGDLLGLVHDGLALLLECLALFWARWHALGMGCVRLMFCGVQLLQFIPEVLDRRFVGGRDLGFELEALGEQHGLDLGLEILPCLGIVVRMHRPAFAITPLGTERFHLLQLFRTEDLGDLLFFLLAEGMDFLLGLRILVGTFLQCLDLRAVFCMDGLHLLRLCICQLQSLLQFFLLGFVVAAFFMGWVLRKQCTREKEQQKNGISKESPRFHHFNLLGFSGRMKDRLAKMPKD
jgi:hypothetical protein